MNVYENVREKMNGICYEAAVVCVDWFVEGMNKENENSMDGIKSMNKVRKKIR